MDIKKRMSTLHKENLLYEYQQMQHCPAATMAWEAYTFDLALSLHEQETLAGVGAGVVDVDKTLGVEVDMNCVSIAVEEEAA